MSHSNGWIGVDLDGCLAKYERWISVEHIGDPIKPMLRRVKHWVSQGINVKIFTARVGPQRSETDRLRAIEVIKDWTRKHIGVELEVTNVKDFGMTSLWDDRAVQVQKNTGHTLGGCHECGGCVYNNAQCNHCAPPLKRSSKKKTVKAKN